MAKKYLDDTGMSYFWGKLKAYFQEKLVSGTNIKTINSESLLGSGDISVASTPTASTISKFDSSAHMNSEDMTSQEVSDFIDSLDAQAASLADYIVEQGTDGIWTYRKWSSGIAECWGITAYTSHAMTQQSGNGYSSQETYNLPSGLFTSINNATASKTGSGGLVSISFYTATTTSLGYYCFCTSSQTITFGIFFNVKGKWK